MLHPMALQAMMYASEENFRLVTKAFSNILGNQERQADTVLANGRDISSLDDRTNRVVVDLAALRAEVLGLQTAIDSLKERQLKLERDQRALNQKYDMLFELVQRQSSSVQESLVQLGSRIGRLERHGQSADDAEFQFSWNDEVD
jgi:chromosome segregation ATPase